MIVGLTPELSGFSVRPGPLKLDGSEYLRAQDVMAAAGISRQTLWRWRQEGKVPAGHRYRDRQLLFTKKEAEAVLRYANRIEPVLNDAEFQPE